MRSRHVQFVLVVVTALLATSCLYQGSWHPAIEATPPTVIDPRWDALQAVDCAGPTDCLAAGSAAATWDGSTWTPAAAPPAVVADLSCAAPDRCLAVSADGAHEWDGVGWATRTLPTGFVPRGVSCSSATLCGVVGRIGTTPQALRWNGTAFTDFALPAASTASDIACTAGRCMAVGSSGGAGWAARWNGATWTSWTIPGSGSLTDVDCASATSCRAGTEVTWLAHWSAYFGWSLSSPQSGALGYRTVACAPPAFCIVGAVTSTGPEDYANSVIGVEGPAILPLAVGNYLDATCTSSTDCVVLENRSSIRRWDGTSWRRDPLALGVAHRESPHDISCATDAVCLVSGSGGNGPVLLRTDGQTAQSVDLDPLGRDHLLPGGTATSCAPDGCAAARTSFGSPPDETSDPPMYVTLSTSDGSDWVHRRFTIGWDEVGPLTAVVDCPSATSCLAVAGNHAFQGAWTWDGSTWTTISSPWTAGTTGSPAALDCASATSCLVASTEEPSEGPPTASSVVREWDGTSWGPALVLPAPPGEVAAVNGIAREPAGYLLVGASANTLGERTPWAARLPDDGATSLADLGLDGPGSLDDVSCTAGGTCLAVGEATRGAPTATGPVAVGWTGSWAVLAGALPTVGDGDTRWQVVDCLGRQCTVAGTTTLPGTAPAPTRIDVARYSWPE